MKDLLDELNFEEVEQKLDDVPNSENEDDPSDRQKQKQQFVLELENVKGKSTDQIFNLTKYHNKGIKGQGIKIAILDSGLGEEYMPENFDTKSGTSMNIIRIIDFTQEDAEIPS